MKSKKLIFGGGMKDDDFRLLFETYYDTLVVFANYWLDDLESAEDVVQDCFVDFLVNRRLENLSEGVDKYIFASVKHAALNFMRSKQRREQRHLVVLREQQESEQEYVELSEEEIEYLYMAINHLPSDRRRIFMMVCLDGKKYQEVANILNISVNTVKTQMGRAFQYLRTVLDKEKFSMFLLILLRTGDLRD